MESSLCSLDTLLEFGWYKVLARVHAGLGVFPTVHDKANHDTYSINATPRRSTTE